MENKKQSERKNIVTRCPSCHNHGLEMLHNVGTCGQCGYTWDRAAEDDDTLIARIQQINAFAGQRFDDRDSLYGAVMPSDANRIETDRMSQILEACRETESTLGDLILSALPQGCEEETDKLAAILAKQRGEPQPCPSCGQDDEPKKSEIRQIMLKETIESLEVDFLRVAEDLARARRHFQEELNGLQPREN